MDRLKPFLLTTTSLVLFAGLFTPVSSQIITTQIPVSSQIITTQPPANDVTVLNGPRIVTPTAGQPTAISPNIIPGAPPVSPNIIPGEPPSSGVRVLNAPLEVVTSTAVFTCNPLNLAGEFSGVVAGTDTGTPYSEFLFVTVNGNGTLTTFEVLGEPGNVAQKVNGTGSWSIFDATNCFLLATVEGKKFDGGNMILLSTPFDPNVQAAGVLRRSGT
jgi:hypothetical protein